MTFSQVFKLFLKYLNSILHFEVYRKSLDAECKSYLFNLIIQFIQKKLKRTVVIVH